MPFEVLDRQGFCRVEPALMRTAQKFVGGLRLPGGDPTLNHVIADLIAQGSDMSRATFCCGLRLMTSDGLPIAGTGAFEGLLWPPATARWAGR